MFRPLAARMTRWLAALPGPAAACRVCAAWPASSFCEDCLRRFARPVHRCASCAIALPAGLPRCGACVRQPPPLDACLAAVDYGFPWDRGIAALKFRGEAGLARALAELLRRMPGAATAIEDAELLLPLPLSPLRLRERGFNQSALIARRLAPSKCDTATLLRIRHTAALSGMDRQARRSHVRGAFALEPARAARVRGRRLLLVDDVMTSGATLHEAARVLRAAGAASVSALVVARTPRP
ncbi:ComF family protein [Xylophilus rhododendri]|uniref:ComF family protein n=1 Tax=Xylophilus rhododendri TaxID=2697032 RepID=A0A857J600_9BURK|nr:phosphoribosyltransferase family protein [Xylophilus rhododendri]QHI99400.1 ComF family protein [Xylophilus rhododendri]